VPPYRFPKTIFSDHSEKLTRLLRAARVEAGLTQVEAAKRLGCRQTFLSKIECGERRLDVAEFSLICLAYGVRPGALLDLFVQEAELKSTLGTRRSRSSRSRRASPPRM
jgi:transcriptional regulator with XRE-family HTH domain